jgi:hypothetical protein
LFISKKPPSLSHFPLSGLNHVPGACANNAENQNVKSELLSIWTTLLQLFFLFLLFAAMRKCEAELNEISFSEKKEKKTRKICGFLSVYPQNTARLELHEHFRLVCVPSMLVIASNDAHKMIFSLRF